jgi:holo-[acyl-carrier protein] synthase
MIVGIGLDVVATARMARSLAEEGEGFAERVFTPGERAACAERADRAQALAARFAAKEACFKALGTGWGDGVSFRQVEVVGLERGRPELRLTGPAAERAQALGVQRAHVTLSHEQDVAAAVVVLES